MKSGKHTDTIIFVACDQNQVEILSEHLHELGFTSKNSEHSDATMSFINDASQKNLHHVKSFSPDVINPEILKMLSSVSSKDVCILIVSQDLSYVKIAMNEKHKSLENHPTISEIERDHIIITLKKCGWKCNTAAKLLGIDRTTLYRKMRKYGITK